MIAPGTSTALSYSISERLRQLPSLMLNTSDTISSHISSGVTTDDGGITVGYNGSSNGSAVERSNTGPWLLTIHSEEHLISTSVILGIMVLCCIVGNCFVIAAVILERSLHNVANYLILSLAVADLMVAVLVMPLSVVAEISKVWFLSREVCDMWVSFDVLCCTASILHLVAIAIDRYWAVTSIDYIRRRSAKRILLMIFVVWTVALTISIPPLFGWRDPNNNPEKTGECIISQDHGYTVFSTVGAFYLPMFIMICIYTRIYMVARSRIRREKFNKRKHASSSPTTARTVTVDTAHLHEHINLTVSHKAEYSVVSNCNGCSPERDTGDHRGRHDGKNGVGKDHSDSSGDNDSAGGGRSGYTNGVADDLPTNFEKTDAGGNDGTQKPCLPSARHRERLEQKRERKAARTLAIITGAFIVCWLPFFILALSGPFIKNKVNIPPVVSSFMLWLGYVNSLFNPIIYTIFSPEFRNAFRKILFGKYSRRGRGRGR